MPYLGYKQGMWKKKLVKLPNLISKINMGLLSKIFRKIAIFSLYVLKKSHFYLKIAFFPYLGHLEYFYKKVTYVKDCLKIDLQTFLLLPKKKFTS